MTDNFAIERLAAVVRAGYEIESYTEDAFLLRHPAVRGLGFVYADGLTVLPSGEGEARFSFDSSQAEFFSFVRTIPRPGWRRSIRVPEWLVICMGCALAVLFVVMIR